MRLQSLARELDPGSLPAATTMFRKMLTPSISTSTMSPGLMPWVSPVVPV
ncbi:MAG TPA: hypothetical protein VK116_05665 [Planctomycetota bacterium]|nr:hypothetical protein [Planctomycetota bacterium]